MAPKSKNCGKELTQQSSQIHGENLSKSTDTRSKHFKIEFHMQIILETVLSFVDIALPDLHADRKVVSQPTVFL
jgi:hypothetical protein